MHHALMMQPLVSASKNLTRLICGKFIVRYMVELDYGKEFTLHVVLDVGRPHYCNFKEIYYYLFDKNTIQLFELEAVYYSLLIWLLI